MADQPPAPETPAIAAGLSPSHTYIPNRGYETSTSQDAPPQTPTGYAADNEDDTYEDIFDDEDEEFFEDMAYDPSSGNLTKAYNRQRKLNDAEATAPRINPQRPVANTQASETCREDSTRRRRRSDQNTWQGQIRSCNQ
jgi:RIO kinase 1